MRLRLLLLPFLLHLAIACRAQSNDSVRVFVDSALNVMQRRSIFAAPLNWDVIRDSVHKIAAKANSYAEAAPAVQFAFNQLQDKHGWLELNGVQYFNPFVKRDNSRINEQTLKAIVRAPIKSTVLEKDYAYLAIPFTNGQTKEKMNAFAQQVQDSLCKVVSAATKGLVIDLRLNGGGNVFPMIIGIINVLGDGTYTESVNSLGEKEGELVIKGQQITLLDTIIVKLQKSCGDLTRLPVAVLTGPATGSSGEQLAIILSIRKNTILIGENTAGYTTGNNGFLLPGADNGIVIGESYTRDKAGKIYLGEVSPSIVVPGGDNFIDLTKDNKIQAALKWLKQQRKETISRKK
ncbi:MAG TPA: S41 family peptidase [Flavisolibacter sp.]|nr:S41 family peptidase [Flavisolibacter sp.]